MLFHHAACAAGVGGLISSRLFTISLRRFGHAGAPAVVSGCFSTAFKRHDYPGNIREENAIEHAVVLTRSNSTCGSSAADSVIWRGSQPMLMGNQYPASRRLTP